MRPLFLLTKSSSKKKQTTWIETISKECSTKFNGDKTRRSAKAYTVFKFLQKKCFAVFCKISSARWTRHRKHKTQIMIRKNLATFLPPCPVKVFHKSNINSRVISLTYIHFAQSKFSTKQKWRNDQSNLYSFCNKQLQNDRPDCYFIRKNFELLKVTLNMAICSVGFVWLILS